METNLPPEGRRTDAFALCRACGLCCDQALFGTVRLKANEVEWAKARRLPLARSGEQLSFRQPCALLRPEGEGRVCGDYEHRPAACRAFRCKLLVRHESGEVSIEDALRTVGRVRGLVASIEQRVASQSGPGSRSSRLDRLRDELRQGDSLTQDAAAVDTLLDVGLVRAALRRDFLEPKPDVEATSREARGKP